MTSLIQSTEISCIDNFLSSIITMLEVALSVFVKCVDILMTSYFPPQAENAVLDLTRLFNCRDGDASLAILTWEF